MRPSEVGFASNARYRVAASARDMVRNFNDAVVPRERRRFRNLVGEIARRPRRSGICEFE